jgi:hypothetical protein
VTIGILGKSSREPGLARVGLMVLVSLCRWASDAFARREELMKPDIGLSACPSGRSKALAQGMEHIV